jgi:hypothetical protein
VLLVSDGPHGHGLLVQDHVATTEDAGSPSAARAGEAVRPSTITTAVVRTKNAVAKRFGMPAPRIVTLPLRQTVAQVAAQVALCQPKQKRKDATTNHLLWTSSRYGKTPLLIDEKWQDRGTEGLAAGAERSGHQRGRPASQVWVMRDTPGR